MDVRGKIPTNITGRNNDLPQPVLQPKAYGKNPFKAWDENFHFSEGLDELEATFHQSHKPVSRPQAPALTEPTITNLTFQSPLVDITGIEELAKRISRKLLETIETQNLIVDRAKLEELKVDNQLMAKHIYTLLQKRGIQEKQLSHMQHEKNRLKHLFWRFYYREQ